MEWLWSVNYACTLARTALCQPGCILQFIVSKLRHDVNKQESMFLYVQSVYLYSQFQRQRTCKYYCSFSKTFFMQAIFVLPSYSYIGSEGTITVTSFYVPTWLRWFRIQVRCHVELLIQFGRNSQFYLDSLRPVQNSATVFPTHF